MGLCPVSHHWLLRLSGAGTVNRSYEQHLSKGKSIKSGDCTVTQGWLHRGQGVKEKEGGSPGRDGSQNGRIWKVGGTSWSWPSDPEGTFSQDASFLQCLEKGKGHIPVG